MCKIRNALHNAPVCRNLGEDPGFARAALGSKRDDADDVITSGAIGTDERTARVPHASRSAWSRTEENTE